jgi:hypothetical protein
MVENWAYLLLTVSICIGLSQQAAASSLVGECVLCDRIAPAAVMNAILDPSKSIVSRMISAGQGWSGPLVQACTGLGMAMLWFLHSHPLRNLPLHNHPLPAQPFPAHPILFTHALPRRPEMLIRLKWALAEYGG